MCPLLPLHFLDGVSSHGHAQSSSTPAVLHVHALSRNKLIQKKKDHITSLHCLLYTSRAEGCSFLSHLDQSFSTCT